MENSVKRANIEKIIEEDIRLIRRYKNNKLLKSNERYQFWCDFDTDYIVRTLAQQEKCSMAAMCAILVHLSQQRFSEVKRYAKKQNKISRRQGQLTPPQQ